jgi:hypothetical protein
MADDQRNREGEQQQDGTSPRRERQGGRSGTRRSGTSEPAGGSGGSGHITAGGSSCRPFSSAPHRSSRDEVTAIRV